MNRLLIGQIIIVHYLSWIEARYFYPIYKWYDYINFSYQLNNNYMSQKPRQTTGTMYRVFRKR